MTHIAVLVCDPAEPVLTDALVSRAASLLPYAEPPRWLAPDIAAEIPFLAGDSPPYETHLADTGLGLVRESLSDAAIDVVALPADEYRRKRLLVADMDSTMIDQECIDELAEFAGVRNEVAAVTERAMRGEIDFEDSLRERVALLKGLDARVIDEVLATRISATPGAATLIATMRAHGAHTALVSGGFSQFTGAVAGRLGFDSHHANTLTIEAGQLTGAVAEPVRGRAYKREMLESLRDSLALAPAETLAVGDGANDLDMLAGAGLGVAFRAKPAVAAAAQARIDHGDLTALLYLQGYAADEFVTV